MSDLMDRKTQILDAVRAQLEQKFAAADRAGVDADVFADVDSIAAAMVAALPIGNVYDQLGGPFYDSGGLITWLDLTRQALNKRIQVGSVIAVQLEDHRGTWVYPTWQFTDDRTVIPGLDDLWRILRPAADDPWMAVFWLRARNPGLGGATPVDWLLAGGDLDTVTAEARADAARWAS